MLFCVQRASISQCWVERLFAVQQQGAGRIQPRINSAEGQIQNWVRGVHRAWQKAERAKHHEKVLVESSQAGNYTPGDGWVPHGWRLAAQAGGTGELLLGSWRAVNLGAVRSLCGCSHHSALWPATLALTAGALIPQPRSQAVSALHGSASLLAQAGQLLAVPAGSEAAQQADSVLSGHGMCSQACAWLLASGLTNSGVTCCRSACAQLV